MSKYVVKGALREVKNYTKGYSDIQAKVRSATSNDPWGPSGTVMNEIAQATNNHQEFIEIMEMIDKRLNDSGKNWRHVFKALTVLDYCIHSGSDHVVEYARDNLYIVKTLKEFQFVDEEGKDQGSNVRQKAKDITSLLSDSERLAQKRRIRNNMHDRMTGSSGNAEYSSGRGYSDDSNNYTDEDKEIQKAIEESKRTAQEHEKKMMRASEEDLRAAIQLSEKEKSEKEARLQNQNSFDFFASSSTNQQPQQQQQQSFDPFSSLDSGIMGGSTAQQDLLGVGFGGNDFGSGGGNMNSFNPYQQQQQQPFGGNNFNNNFNVGTVPPPTNHSTNPFGAAFGGSSVQTPPVSNMNNFGSAFDGGKNMSHDENLMARSGAQIDPFANVASSRNVGDASGHHLNNPFGATIGSDTFGGVMAPNGRNPPSSAPATFPSGLPSGIRPNLVNLDALSNTPPANSSSSPFASRNPFATSAGASNGNLSSSSNGAKKYDWGGNSGGTGPKQQRTLAELAATSTTPVALSPNMSASRGMGMGGGMNNMTGSTGMIGMGGGQPMQQNLFGQQPGTYSQANPGMYGQGQGMGGGGGSFNNSNPTLGNQQGGSNGRNGSGNVFF